MGKVVVFVQRQPNVGYVIAWRQSAKLGSHVTSLPSLASLFPSDQPANITDKSCLIFEPLRPVKL